MIVSRRITLKDVAAELGVSTATVSNAFNRPSQLSARTRRRVLEGASRLGYNGPNASAQSLRTGRSNIVTVVLGDTLSYGFHDAVASALLRGVAEVLDSRGQNLLIISGREVLTAAISRASIGDGIIVYGSVSEPDRLSALLKSEGRPVVTVDCELDGFPTIGADDQAASYRLARHALTQAPARIAIIGLQLAARPAVGRLSADAPLLPPAQSVARQRYDGLRRALDETVPAAPVALWNVDENVETCAAPVIDEVLDAPDGERADLVFCLSDRIALAVIDRARRRGLAVPADFRVTGFDGLAEGRYKRPTLTTVRQDSAAKGRLAAAMALDFEHAGRRRVANELIIGESCP